MYEDAIVEEVRRIRDEYARQFGYDLEAIARDLKEREAKSGRRYVSLPPKRLMRKNSQEQRGVSGSGFRPRRGST